MHVSLMCTALLALLLLIPAARCLPAMDEVDVLAAVGLTNRLVYNVRNKSFGNKKCNIFNAAIRREWGSLSKHERRKYIDAVLCMLQKPSLSDPTEVPGARNRFDDFLAVHINQTLTIHGTGNFLTWHRYFTWAYEQALRNECGYDGYQPYWAWNKYASDPINSPIFDGSEYSMSGNGEYVKHNGTPATPYTTLPPGPGGGCVVTGPFKNMTVNLGPVAPTLDGVVPQQGNGLNYNPRCLRRDISVAASQGWTKTSDVTSLIRDNSDIYWFQTIMQGQFEKGFLGVHTGGHFTIGGDPGGDLYSSPGDPAFYLHHAQIDRVFWIWQNQDPRNRLDVVSGTVTINNMPPSRNATLDDEVNLGILAPAMPLRDLLDTMGGPFCYIYI